MVTVVGSASAGTASPEESLAKSETETTVGADALRVIIAVVDSPVRRSTASVMMGPCADINGRSDRATGGAALIYGRERHALALRRG